MALASQAPTRRDVAKDYERYKMVEFWHHDNCIRGGKKRGVGPTCTARHGALEPVAYLMAWHCAGSRVSQDRRTKYVPTAAEVAEQVNILKRLA